MIRSWADGHQQHAADRKQQQRVIFAALDVHALEVIVGQGYRRQPAAQEDDVQIDRKTIRHDHIVEGGQRTAALGEA